MFYCIELHTVYFGTKKYHVDKLVVYKRTQWTGKQIAKLDITSAIHKTTFKKFYKTAVKPADLTVNKKVTYFTNGYSYVKYLRIYKSLIKLTRKLGVAQ